MTDRYRKWGRSVRRESGRVVNVDEAGEAFEESGVFQARPIDEARDLPAPDPKLVDAASRQIESIVKPPLILERIFVSEANVAHECNGIRWRETLRRVHVAIARPPIRAFIDLAAFQFDAVERVATALTRVGGERPAPKRMRIAESVGAALLPILPVEKSQTSAEHDGIGLPVGARPVGGEPPNWFRPSYRMRPRRAWFHLRAEAFGSIDEALPEAIALLAPVDEDRIAVLCADGNRVFPAVVPVRKVLAARPGVTWYPYGAGAFGAELVF
jgi:hypothetical protein